VHESEEFRIAFSMLMPAGSAFAGGSELSLADCAMAPFFLLYKAVAANLAQVLSGRVRTGRTAIVLLVVGLAATVAVAALVTRLARRRLEHELAP